MAERSEHVPTLVIGGGQAGLAVAHHLRARGSECLVVEANARVGDSWRRHWDSIRLFTPGRYDGLPGMRFPGDPRRYPGKDDMADYLEAYAAEQDLPVRLRTRVDRLGAGPDGGFVASVGTAEITCEHVVVATGTYTGRPRVPACAAELAPGVRQLHSSEYHRPSDLLPGPALVVGAANSGCEIAFELAADRRVVLCGRDPGHEPFRPGTAADRLAVPATVFVARHVATRRGPLGRRLLTFRHHGIPVGRVRAKDLRARGVEKVEARMTGVEGGMPALGDGSVHEVANVVWCTGFAPDYGWIDLPAFDDDGFPREYRGIADDVPGLYFCGLVLQHSVASSVLPGVGRDAAFVARALTAAPERPR
ncbi:NAD(P)/FAD-dependent oxidoreductase [Isoptericola sp. BMS4]|uniref:flavin-containing monooxygenase n=1 Tax=Isoptericola sp. BMS4 TaxID=2527875 RepID=UPI00141F6DC9|nr:FAD-dependent oxidoreductase [Isoptericola sp. BMS4]